MRAWIRRLLPGVACGLVIGCGGSAGPSTPTPVSVTSVRFEYRAATAPRTDLPAAAQACARMVSLTHMHPSWREFLRLNLTPVPPDRFEITLADVPVGTTVSFRINDGNRCDENPTGAVTRNVFANDVALLQNASTPGTGSEPGFAFTVSSDGRITQ